MKEGFIIYGCNGFTGNLISKHAVELGLKPVLAGRDEQKVKALAQELNLSYKIFDVRAEDAVAENIKEFKVVLHCAGPFKYTAAVMAKACIKAKTHYLDITGEYPVFEQIFGLDKEAKEAGITLLSGVGFDVVPSDCLALYLKKQLPTATSLALALYNKGGKSSQGTAITVAEYMGYKTMHRKGGQLEELPANQSIRTIEMDGKQRQAIAISWGDISTAWRSTAIPGITVFNVLPPNVIKSIKMSAHLGFLLRNRVIKNFIISKIKKRPAGPDEATRNTARSMIWGEVKNTAGQSHRAMLNMPEGYKLTALTAVKIVTHFLNNNTSPGAQTPALIFGEDFILQFADVIRIDLRNN